MAESREHRFVTEAFLGHVRSLSKSRLYGYREADRGRFDFACMLETDRSRPVVGQTLTHHAEGIEKDLNWLLFDQDSDLPIYLYANLARNETRIREILHNARKSVPDRVRLLRLYPYPAGVDAGDESQRKTISDILRKHIVDDLLLNVLLGRLSAVNVDLFLGSTGIPGLLLAALEGVALYGYVNRPQLAQHLGDISPTTVGKRIDALVACGMLHTPRSRALMYRTAPRAEALLKICSLLTKKRSMNPELSYILDQLGLDGISRYVSGYSSIEEAVQASNIPLDRRRLLIFEVVSARKDFGVPISGGPYPEHRGVIYPPPCDTEWTGH